MKELDQYDREDIEKRKLSRDIPASDEGVVTSV